MCLSLWPDLPLLRGTPVVLGLGLTLTQDDPTLTAKTLFPDKVHSWVPDRHEFGGTLFNPIDGGKGCGAPSEEAAAVVQGRDKRGGRRTLSKFIPPAPNPGCTEASLKKKPPRFSFSEAWKPSALEPRWLRPARAARCLQCTTGGQRVEPKSYQAPPVCPHLTLGAVRGRSWRHCPPRPSSGNLPVLPRAHLSLPLTPL